MLNTIFSIDGTYYDVLISSLKRKALLKEGSNSGTFMSGEYDRDLIGTFFEYDMEIAVNKLNATEYDSLYEVLTDAVESHTVIFPYNQTTLTFTAYVESVSDEFGKIVDGVYTWQNLSVTFISTAPVKEVES